MDNEEGGGGGLVSREKSIERRETQQTKSKR